MSELALPNEVEDPRVSDLNEAESVKYNIARIVRLSSGRYALFSPHPSGALDLVSVGTVEEIAPIIPTAAECAVVQVKPPSSQNKAGLDDLLSTLGL